MAKPKSKWDFRDVSIGLQMLREFLLGRKHTLHNRFEPKYSPRSIPPPDIPRGPVYKYSNQYYGDRNVPASVKPPVVAPVAEGPPVNQNPYKKVQPGGLKPDSLIFNCAPSPGTPWWWDGHCFYEVQPGRPEPQCPSAPTTPDCPEQTTCPNPEH